MAAALDRRDQVGILRRQLAQARLVVLADGLGDSSVGLGPADGDQVGEGGQLLLPVRHQRAELGQTIVLGIEEHPRARVFAAGEALAHHHHVRHHAVFLVGEEPLAPDAGLNLVVHRRHIVFGTQLVGALDKGRLEAARPVVHHHELMEEGRDLALPRVGFPEHGFQILQAVGADAANLIQPGIGQPRRQLGPHAAGELGEQRGAMVVGGQVAIVVPDHQDDGAAPRVFRLGRAVIDPVEAGQTQLQRGFVGDAASL